jgi:hypothetical protein
MKIISLTQPWATLVVTGQKRWETRSWLTHYRGVIAIHAASGFPKAARALCRRSPFFDCLPVDAPHGLPLGAIIGFARIVRCVPTFNLNHDPDFAGLIGERERAFGDYTDGRFAWELKHAGGIEPIPCRGWQRIWNAPPEVAAQMKIAV